MNILQKMRKNILIFAIFMAVGFFGYTYLFGGGRDFANEEAIKVSSVESIFSEFSKNEQTSNKKYLNKVIEISGKVTQVDTDSNAIMMDGKVYASFKKNDFMNFNENENINIKGRFLGYDDLLEELKLDNCTVIK